MGALQPIHWIVILLIVLMVFGLGKLPAAMGDMGKSIRNFRDQVSGEDDKAATAHRDPSKRA